MSASFLPAILLPLVGLVFPALTMAFMTIYFESDNVDDVV